MKVCSLKGCDIEQYRKGVCQKHYNTPPSKKRVRQPNGKQRKKLRLIKQLNRKLPIIRNKGTTPESQKRYMRENYYKYKEKRAKFHKKYNKSHVPKRILAKMDEMEFSKGTQQAFIMDGKRLDNKLKTLEVKL